MQIKSFKKISLLILDHIHTQIFSLYNENHQSKTVKITTISLSKASYINIKLNNFTDLTYSHTDMCGIIHDFTYKHRCYINSPGTVAHDCHPSTWKAEASLGCTVRYLTNILTPWEGRGRKGKQAT